MSQADLSTEHKVKALFRRHPLLQWSVILLTLVVSVVLVIWIGSQMIHGCEAWWAKQFRSGEEIAADTARAAGYDVLNASCGRQPSGEFLGSQEPCQEREYWVDVDAKDSAGHEVRLIVTCHDYGGDCRIGAEH